MNVKKNSKTFLKSEEKRNMWTACAFDELLQREVLKVYPKHLPERKELSKDKSSSDPNQSDEVEEDDDVFIVRPSKLPFQPPHRPSCFPLPLCLTSSQIEKKEMKEVKEVSKSEMWKSDKVTKVMDCNKTFNQSQEIIEGIVSNYYALPDVITCLSNDGFERTKIQSFCQKFVSLQKECVKISSPALMDEMQLFWKDFVYKKEIQVEKTEYVPNWQVGRDTVYKHTLKFYIELLEYMKTKDKSANRLVLCWPCIFI